MGMRLRLFLAATALLSISGMVGRPPAGEAQQPGRLVLPLVSRDSSDCAAWDLAQRPRVELDPATGAGRTVLDRLAPGGQPEQLLAAWLSDNCRRLNHLQVLGTHNSYHVEPLPFQLLPVSGAPPPLGSSEYTHRPLDQQLGLLGVRQVEIDVFADPEGGRYAGVGVPLPGLPPPIAPRPELLAAGLKVLHSPDVDKETTCLTFVACLRVLKGWSEGRPGHLPILVLVEAKEDNRITPGPALTFGAAALDEIDSSIRSLFPADRLILPDALRGSRATLREAIEKDGWPALNESRGRFFFALVNTGEQRDLYLAGHPSSRGRVLFTMSDGSGGDHLLANVDDPVADGGRIRELVAAGYLVRTRSDAGTVEARSGSTARREAAIASGAHYVSTDFPEPDPEFRTGYFVAITGERNARCNPVLSPPGCSAAALER